MKTRMPSCVTCNIFPCSLAVSYMMTFDLYNIILCIIIYYQRTTLSYDVFEKRSLSLIFLGFITRV